MIRFEFLSNCSLKEMVDLMNHAFQDYFTEMKTDVSSYVKRLAKEDLSPDLSIVAYDKEKPVGFILNGIREINNQKIAWNGGTGVIPDYRGQGIGRLMMEKCFEIYHQQQVEVATLEAIDRNLTAIHLYSKMGYQIIDHLKFYSLDLKKAKSKLSSLTTEHTPNTVQSIFKRDLVHLPFFRRWAPWQNQLASLPDAEAIILSNEKNETIGYALFQVITSLQTVNFFHLEVTPKEKNRKDIFIELISHVINKTKPAQSYRTFNLHADIDLDELLREIGFDYQLGQVWMTKTLS
ncbi:GNAT family N-acetyltransferase [Thermoflavimicrobium daqui]|nr:GNAT family N-acetyltransferase [Thermoflavimicrobium daqui]